MVDSSTITIVLELAEGTKDTIYLVAVCLILGLMSISIKQVVGKAD